MRIGIPREVKDNEFRVALTPAGVRELTNGGHEVLVEQGAGAGSSMPDEEYVRAGGRIIASADDVWADAELVCKVKEPVAEEFHRLRSDLVLFTYLHLASSRPCTDAVVASGVTAIAYETVQLADGSLPLLAPMSEVAGRMGPMVGAQHLMRSSGGRGALMSGVPGVHPARVVVLGAGVAGSNAAAVAAGMRAEVVVLDRDLGRLRTMDHAFGGQIRTVAATVHTIEQECLAADLVVGAVLVPGAKAPKLVTNELAARMKQGSVLVDISVDQGGCFEATRPTTHSDPVFLLNGSVFYCVANMPGAVPHTSTHALTNVTLPYMLAIAGLGWREAVRRDRALALGVNAVDGELVSAPVGAAHGLATVELAKLIA